MYRICLKFSKNCYLVLYAGVWSVASGFFLIISVVLKAIRVLALASSPGMKTWVTRLVVSNDFDFYENILLVL